MKLNQIKSIKFNGKLRWTNYRINNNTKSSCSNWKPWISAAIVRIPEGSGQGMDEEDEDDNLDDEEREEDREKSLGYSGKSGSFITCQATPRIQVTVYGLILCLCNNFVVFWFPKVLFK